MKNIIFCKLSVISQVKEICSQLLSLKLLILVLTFNFLFFSANSFSQNFGVGINITGSSANPKSLLDLDAAGMNPKAGLLLPRMSTTERDAITSPIPESLLIYNTDSHCFEAYYNGVWVSWACLGSCLVPSQPMAGTNIPSPTQIVWNWSTVNNPVSYKWGTNSSYSSATDIGINVSYTQTCLSCNTSYTLYVWAYNACGNSSYTTLTQNTSACSSPAPCLWNSSNTFTDSRDEQTYSQVQIGTQCWMAQNLNYGTCIACVTGGQTDNGKPEKYCVNSGATTDNYPSCICPYGGLYEFGEAVQYFNGATNITSWSPVPTGNVQGVCPNGWHIPSHYEWTTLEQAVCAQSPAGPDCSNTAFPYDYIGNSPVGTNEGGKMKETCTTDWTTPNTGATNNSGFTALPGGNCYGGVFSNAGNFGWWWAATETNYASAWDRHLEYLSATVHIDSGNKKNGFSVRCLKD